MEPASRFHKAADKGDIAVLREATKKDSNKQDDMGMTPTLIAAHQGNMDALRLLVSRGGDPDLCDFQGYTALHFAALKGSIQVVTFLTSFGCNIWALTNDLRTALQLAGENEHQDCVDILDDVSQQKIKRNQRDVAKKREKATKDAEDRIKKFQKLQQKTIGRNQKKQRNSVINGGAPMQDHYQRKSVNSKGQSTVSGRYMSRRRSGQISTYMADGHYSGIYNTKADEDVDGLPGVNPELKANTSRATASALLSMPSIPAQNGNFGQTDNLDDVTDLPINKRLSTFSSGPEEYENFDDDDPSNISSPLQLFLAVNELSDYLPLFTEEDVDLKALMLLKEEDLLKMGLGLGPRKKITTALENRKIEINTDKPMTDSFL